MGWTFRRDLSRPLHDTEFDGNTDEAKNRIDALEMGATEKQIAGFDVAAGGVFYVRLNDDTLLGPYQLPLSRLNARGEWAPATAYVPMDSFYINGAAYVVLFAHVSAGSFDPGANDGGGHDYYGLILQSPSNVLPTGGDTGDFFRKASEADYHGFWTSSALSDQSDVDFNSAGPDEGEFLRFISGKWTNSAFAIDFADIGGTLDLDQLPAINFTDIEGTVAEDQLLQTTKRTVTQSGASLSIDRSLGEICALSLTATITSFSVSNWTANGLLGRIVLHVNNTGAFNITGWPSGTIWAGGTPPTITSGSGKKDVVMLTTYDGGTVIYGHVVGQDFA